MTNKTHKYNKKTKRKVNNTHKKTKKYINIKKLHDYTVKGIDFLSKVNNGIQKINNLINYDNDERHNNQLSGDPPFICFIASILSRMAYKRNGILDDYITIFHENIINHDFLMDIRNNKINDIFNDAVFFKLTNTISSRLYIDYAKKINKKLSDDKINIKSSKNVMYISITTSNYSSVYVIADKIMNSIWVVFKGTDSPKNMSIYSKPSSFVPIMLCDGVKDGMIEGIFKILSEIINTIMHSIEFLSVNFLKSNKKASSSVKIFTCGHSLGGALATIFTYLWIGLKNNTKSPYYSKNGYDMNKICCITFGTPRVLNGYAIQKFNKLIEKGYIFYRRIANEGDPCVNLPFASTFFDSGYFHPDEYHRYNRYNRVNNKYLVFYCNPILEKKILNETHVDYEKMHLCNHFAKEKDLKTQFNSTTIYAHSLYFYILYHNLLKITDYTGMIKRYDYDKRKYSDYYGGDTMGRIIIAGGESETKIGFYNLYEVEGRKILSEYHAKNDNNNNNNNKNNYYNTIVEYIKPKINIQDSYMTKKVFDFLVKNSSIITTSNKSTNTNTNTNNTEINPLKGNVIFLPIHKESIPIEKINCYTSQFCNTLE